MIKLFTLAFLWVAFALSQTDKATSVIGGKAQLFILGITPPLMMAIIYGVAI